MFSLVNNSPTAVSSYYFLEGPSSAGSDVNCYADFTERRGRVFNIPASYSGGPEFKSRPGDHLS
jgi:hypothetical protein